MIIRHTGKKVSGITNREHKYTASDHMIMYADGGLAELENWLAKTPKKWSREDSVTTYPKDNWDLNAGWDGAMAMAKDGWHEGAAMIDAKLQAIMPATGRTARWGYDVRGTSVNVSRYLTGHPRNMRSRTKKTSGSAPVLQIGVNIVASWAVPAKAMANYGTAIVGLIDRLENTGKRVHLDVFMIETLRGNTRLSAGWNVKQASEHVDLSAIAFSIAHPAAFRRLGFAMIERSPSSWETSGYGMPTGVSPDDLPDAGEGVMLLDGLQNDYRRCNTEKDALLFACEQLNEAALKAGHATEAQPLLNVEDILEIIAA